MSNQQLASSVMMVRPKHFNFNQQTGLDNSFQSPSILTNEEVRRNAEMEFNQMAENLLNHGVEVLVFDPEYPQGVSVPDAVFPNNWFSTSENGDIYIFPMLTENRRQERQAKQLVEFLTQAGYGIQQVSWVGNMLENDYVLEGTGAVIFDHKHREIYAGLSQRCDENQLLNFSKISGYNLAMAFSTSGMDNKPIYHTNVMMSIGNDFVVICLESLKSEIEKAQVLEKLHESGRNVIDISLSQMSQMCGNVLQISNQSNEPLIAMSQSAYRGFSKKQISVLEKNSELVVSAIPTIESIGGGSCRCMMAELFLPKVTSFIE